MIAAPISRYHALALLQDPRFRPGILPAFELTALYARIWRQRARRSSATNAFTSTARWVSGLNSKWDLK